MMNIGDSAQIKGCSSKTRHLETSSGNSSIDSLLGGGIPNTSICLVDEVKSRVYATTLAKYFVSEGLYNDHDLLLAGPPGLTSEILKSLPSRSEASSSSASDARSMSGAPSSTGNSDGMKIAWRYEAVGQVNSSIGNKNIYDLQKTLDSLSRFASSVSTFPTDTSQELSYVNLLNVINALLKAEKYQKTRGAGKNLLRIVILGIGSPFWTDPENFTMFLARLQTITRNSYCIVFGTTCSGALNAEQTRELEVTSDIFFRLIAITDEERKTLPGMDKHHGFFHLIRLPTLISPAFPKPPAVDLAFELHRKSFDVKVLHLPPALGAEPTKSACNVDF